jgi:type IV pilus assembly protein PilE
MRRAGGFTLIEVMIVVVVIGILAAVSYPSYNSYMARSRRADAQQLMAQMDSRQKQILIEQRAFATQPSDLNVGGTGWTCDSTKCQNTYYEITFDGGVTNSPPAYTICAKPRSGTTQVSDGSLTLTYAGTKQRLTGSTACTGGTPVPW